MKNEKKKNNVISFPGQLSTGEREVEAILFAAAEPLEIETIEDRISKKISERGLIASDLLLEIASSMSRYES